MIRLTSVLVLSIAIACGQSRSLAQDVGAETATTAITTKLGQILDRLQSIEQRLRSIESRFDLEEKGSNSPSLDLPTECIVIDSPAPGTEIVPGQILGRIEPLRREQMISPWLEPGTVIKRIEGR